MIFLHLLRNQELQKVDRVVASRVLEVGFLMVWIWMLFSFFSSWDSGGVFTWNCGFFFLHSFLVLVLAKSNVCIVYLCPS